MRILILTQFFWPEARTAPTNLGALAEDLTKRGHEVMVITGVPNHPLGRVYEGYKMKLWQWEQARGFQVLRLPLYPDHSQSVLRRLLNYGSFVLSASILGVWFSRKFQADVMFVYFAPLTMGLVAWVFKVLRRVSMVYWITDIWPENLHATGIKISDLVYGWLRRLEDWSYRQADILCVDSPGYEQNLVQKHVDATRIRVVPEWADETLFFLIERESSLGAKFGLAGKFNVIYGGNLGRVQHLSTALQAAALVQDLEDFQLVFIGDGTETETLKQQVIDLKLANVQFIGRQPMETIHQFFAWADALFVHLERSPIFELQLPSKVLAYMACGRPILCAVPGVVETIIRETGAGLCCPSESPGELAQQIRLLYQTPKHEREEMGKRAREAYLKQYTRNAQVNRIEHILQSTLS